MALEHARRADVDAMLLQRGEALFGTVRGTSGSSERTLSSDL